MNNVIKGKHQNIVIREDFTLKKQGYCGNSDVDKENSDTLL